MGGAGGILGALGEYWGHWGHTQELGVSSWCQTLPPWLFSRDLPSTDPTDCKKCVFMISGLGRRKRRRGE